jgi:hypothetical protein
MYGVPVYLRMRLAHAKLRDESTADPVLSRYGGIASASNMIQRRRNAWCCL